MMMMVIEKRVVGYARTYGSHFALPVAVKMRKLGNSFLSSQLAFFAIGKNFLFQYFP
jgi:hypothetical protein